MPSRKKTAWILTGSSLAMMAVLGFWFVRDPEGLLRDRMGLNSGAFALPWAWVLAAAVTVGYVAYTLYAVPFVDEHKLELSRFKLFGVWIAPLSGTVEEIVFRRMLMDAAEGWGLHAGWQIAVSAVLFSLAHSVWVLFSGDVRIVFPVMLSTLALGALLAAVYIAAGRNVLPAIAAHTLINLVIEPWLLLSAVSGDWAGTRKRPVS